MRTLFLQSTSCILWRRMHHILCEREQKCTSSWTVLWSLKAISSYCVTVISNRIEPIRKHVHPIVLVPRKQNWGRAFDLPDRILELPLLFLVTQYFPRNSSYFFLKLWEIKNHNRETTPQRYFLHWNLFLLNLPLLNMISVTLQMQF